MRLDRFESERSPAWALLEERLQSSRGRPERLGLDGVLELGRLYRAASADLALVRRRFPGYPVVDRLEPLVLAARQAIYAERTRTGTLRAYLLRGYWQEIFANRRLLAVSLFALFAPALLAGAWAARDPGAAVGLAPSGFAAAAAPHAHNLPSALGVRAASATGIFTNNIEVTFLAFAGGLLFGAGTLLVLAFNGFLLGLLAGLTIQAGTFSVFIRLVAPHGLLELSCICVAGLAGLRLARALVDPGLRTRGEALQAEARPAVLMVLGTAPWLVLAGVTEGLVTPDELPLAAAIVLGVGLATLYWSLVLLRGRPAHSAREDDVEPASTYSRALALARR